MLGLQIGAAEVLIVLGVVVFFFGAKRLPGLARAIGRSARDVRRGLRDDVDDDQDD